VDLAQYCVNAVLVEGRSVRAVAAATGRSKSWVQRHVSLYRAGGEVALVPKKRGPKVPANLTSPALEDAIVAWRKYLSEDGLDAGARTIHWHLSQDGGTPPALSTIHRVLRRRGFVTPQPQKRPRSSWMRFESSLPNECWQSDMTHWHLDDDTPVEVINFVDDYSRAVLASVAVPVATAADVVRVFYEAAATYGLPTEVLSDIQADCALGSTVRPAGGGKLRGDRCPLCIAADRSERLTTPCLLGVSRAGATPGKERPVRYSVTGPGRIPVGECPARPPRWRRPSVPTRQGGRGAKTHAGNRCRLPGGPPGQPG
jgi:transposase